MAEVKSIRILNRSDASQYEAVQTASLAAAKGFVAGPEAVKWYSGNEVYPTLGAFHGNQLVSVMRLEWVLHWQELNSKMQSNFYDPQITLPAAYITKNGTLPQLMSLGLNSLLRYHALKISLTWPVEYILGTMIEGSPRVESMIQMGYRFYTNPVKWEGCYQSNKNALIGYLNLKKTGTFALNYLENKYPDLLSAYRPDFNPQDVKIKVPVRSVS